MREVPLFKRVADFFGISSGEARRKVRAGSILVDGEVCTDEMTLVGNHEVASLIDQNTQAPAAKPFTISVSLPDGFVDDIMDAIRPTLEKAIADALLKAGEAQT